MIEISPDTMWRDLADFQKITIDSNLFFSLSELGFLDEYSPLLIAERVDRLSPEQKAFLVVRLESEDESPESKKIFLREHLGLNTDTEDEFRAKIIDVLDNKQGKNI